MLLTCTEGIQDEVKLREKVDPLEIVQSLAMLTIAQTKIKCSLVP